MSAILCVGITLFVNLQGLLGPHQQASRCGYPRFFVVWLNKYIKTNLGIIGFRVQSNMKPFMIYTGNHLFHYTKFESALRIIVSGSLIFGDFKNMNDIAEAYREVFGMADDTIINKVLADYQSISLTTDKLSKRGFSNDLLWGHYAQKGDGVCLVFDKEKLKRELFKQFKKNAKMARIKYVTNHVGTVFTVGNTEDEVRQYVSENTNKLFFTKSKEWKYEDEIRIIKMKESDAIPLYFGDALMAVILCLPKIDSFTKYIESPEFQILKKILLNKPILRYTTMLGNKELLDEQGEKTCSIVGVDIHLAI